MILKFCENKSEEDKLREIKALLTENNLNDIFPEESRSKGSNSLVRSLLKSIESL